MKLGRVAALLFVLAFLSVLLVLTLLAPPSAPAHGQVGPGVAWQKQVWLNGVPVSPGDVTVQAGDVVEIEDRVWITNTAGLEFTLVTTWTESLSLTGSVAGSGQAEETAGGLIWDVDPAPPNTWHVLTKTFDVLPGVWTTDVVTEDLEVELFGDDQWVLSLDYRAASLYLTKAVYPANQVPGATVTYTLVWGNDGGYAPGVVLKDTLPSQIVFLEADPPGTYDPLAHELTWGPFDLVDEDRMEATILGAIGENVKPDTSITNFASLLYADAPPVTAQVTHRSMTPCVKVEGVTLSVLSPPPFYPRRPIQLQANVSPDNAGTPFRYQLVLDGIAGTMTGATVDPIPLTVSFVTAGEHTVVVNVWNCNLSIGQGVSDSAGVEITPFRLYVPLLVRDS
jgi:uncharacterized repeat protein (TIGR01451 family)